MAAPKKYPDGLRERAVRLYQETYPRPVIRRPAEQLGVHYEALRNWIRQDEANRGERNDRPTTAETEELRRLRRENAELRTRRRTTSSSTSTGGTRPNASNTWTHRGSTDWPAHSPPSPTTGLAAPSNRARRARLVRPAPGGYRAALSARRHPGLARRRQQGLGHPDRAR
ncbi:transposase [Pseudonocardia alaniniphila]|uniref:transposase n=1 Tax=Pseudonocardia alaniniphila TaxID=75291 RepID=UPI00364236A8